MNVDKAAVLKVAAVKALVGKVDVLKSDSAGVEADDFLPLEYVIVNVVLDFLLVWKMVHAIVFALGNLAVVVKDGKRRFFAAFGQTLVLLEHSLIINHLWPSRNRQERVFLLLCFL